MTMIAKMREAEPIAPAAAISRGRSAGFYRRSGKRLGDLLFVLLTAPVGIPLILMLALLVSLDGGKPFYSQLRLGRGGRSYRMWKLRTMIPDADAALAAHLERDPAAREEWSLKQKLERDPRVTRLGNFLRRTSLDELPQLWNVLIGDMAIIGPRPLVAADLDAMADSGRARSRARPGITGWAQVNGGQQLDADEKLALDLWYADHASLALDLRIIGRTLHMMLMGERRDPSAIDTARAALVPEVMGAAE